MSWSAAEMRALKHYAAAKYNATTIAKRLNKKREMVLKVARGHRIMLRDDWPKQETKLRSSLWP